MNQDQEALQKISFYRKRAVMGFIAYLVVAAIVALAFLR